MSYLEFIHSPDDVKKLPDEELDAFCAEIRGFLIEHVSQTGGHLASNLGAVELTVALHRVFNTAYDRLLFDVGHQCYVHKMLTGRANDFDTLRQYGGIAGFPKPAESMHDAFIAGHASDSVSLALGMARARRLKNESYQIICVIGDGAMTGGLAWEGLFELGASGLPVIVILNDNGISINPNTGGLGQYLKRLRFKPSYTTFKRHYRKLISAVPGGKYIYKLTHRMKEKLKASVLKSSMFEEMGFEYSSPVDGHDIIRLEEAFKWAKEKSGPTLVHVITKKGKGYPPAESNPGKFHGIGPFDPVSGDLLSKKIDFSAVFGEEMLKLGSENSAICAITAAMKEGTGLSAFATCYPERFFDVGIAEEHAVSMAAGMADRGLNPVFAVYSTFLQRSYDMLIHDLAISNQHVVLAVDRAGIVGSDGETHHGLFDVAYLSSIPGMTVYAPSSFAELRLMLRNAVYQENGPVAIRYSRGNEGRFKDCVDKPLACIRNGEDITIISYGISVNNCLDAADILNQKGISARILKIGRICPLPSVELISELAACKRLIIVEEANEMGSVGMQIAALLSQNNIHPSLHLINTGRNFLTHGNVDILREKCGLDAASIACTAEVMYRE